MFGDILFLFFVFFSFFQFFEGIKMAIQSPLLFLSGVFSLILSYLLIYICDRRETIKISSKGNFLIYKIAQNRTYRIVLAVFLWILAFGNFVYADSWIGGSISKGVEYLEPIILSLISFAVLNTKKETKQEGF